MTFHKKGITFSFLALLLRDLYISSENCFICENRFFLNFKFSPELSPPLIKVRIKTFTKPAS